MKQIRRYLRVVLSSLALVFLGTMQAQAAEEINFGIISVDASNALKTSWQPFFDDMSKATGLTIKPFFATDYAGIIEGMRFNKVQVAWYGNASAIVAVDRSNGEVFAKTIRLDGSEGYNSLLITNVNSPYKTLDDFFKHTKDINFGIGDPNSTSGTKVPSYYIFAKHNINPKTDFKSIRSANHATNLLAVANNQIDVATNNTEDWERMEAKSPELMPKIRILWKSPLIPADPFVWRKDLPAATKEKIKTFMLNYGKGPNAAAEKENLKAIVMSGIVASSNDQLFPIRQLELFTDLTKVQNDTTYSPEEKSKKIAEIQAKLDDLEKSMKSK
jgi:phosphonate transport system substrate-binding protein